jgi:hypothetical protein
MLAVKRGYLLAALLLSVCWSGCGWAEPLRFFAGGDLPYADAEAVLLERLLARAVATEPAFIVHVGDIKGGSQPCTDARYRKVARLFRAQPVPVVFTPGDNEWTDCHRERAGAHDPLERLVALRAAFFDDPAVLHRDPLRPVVPDPAYPENLYFALDGVLFALVHLVGSNNNLRPKNARAMKEMAARNAANRRLLDQAARAANGIKARAIVLAFHANPLFEEQGPRQGFLSLKQDLRQLLAAYAGPVLLVHGDTHRFRFDRPLRDADGAPIARVQRLEVPGSPFVAGVWVTVDTDSALPFDVQMVYPDDYRQFTGQ